jgi:hypothetical protein
MVLDPVSLARLRSPPFVCVVRHRNKPAPEPVRRHRITHACICKVLATAAAYPKRAHVHKCALNVAIDACLALTEGQKRPAQPKRGANGSTWTYEYLPYASRCMHLPATKPP